LVALGFVFAVGCKTSQPVPVEKSDREHKQKIKEAAAREAKIRQEAEAKQKELLDRLDKKEKELQSQLSAAKAEAERLAMQKKLDEAKAEKEKAARTEEMKETGGGRPRDRPVDQPPPRVEPMRSAALDGLFD
jgi:multidrug efflux pump subunit AcrA (membrane-fusion protein)